MGPRSCDPQPGMAATRKDESLEPGTACNVPGFFFLVRAELLLNVRFWHLADIKGVPPDVRFRGECVAKLF